MTSALACPFCSGAGDAAFPGAPCHQCLGGFAQRQVERVLVGEYELLEQLGEGATSVVHRGEHRRSGEVVAIKLAKPELLQRSGGARWFLRQARTESLLRHPHIVGVHGTGELGGGPFLVMPWMEGGTLADASTLARSSSVNGRSGE